MRPATRTSVRAHASLPEPCSSNRNPLVQSKTFRAASASRATRAPRRRAGGRTAPAPRREEPKLRGGGGTTLRRGGLASLEWVLAWRGRGSGVIVRSKRPMAGRGGRGAERSAMSRATAARSFGRWGRSRTRPAPTASGRRARAHAPAGVQPRRRLAPHRDASRPKRAAETMSRSHFVCSCANGAARKRLSGRSVAIASRGRDFFAPIPNAIPVAVNAAGAEWPESTSIPARRALHFTRGFARRGSCG